MKKEKEKKEINLFTFLNQIQSKNRRHEYDRKIANAYMLTQWLSHDKDIIEKCNDINKYQFILPDEVVYNYYMSVIPKGRRFLKWSKKRKEDERLKKRIEKLKEYDSKLSTKECKIMIEFLERKKNC